MNHSFKNCKNKKHLFFDFYIPRNNTCIEFDGLQHFKPGWFSTERESKFEKLERTQKNDRIKNRFCKKENIRLIRISYKRIDKIEKILKKKIVL